MGRTTSIAGLPDDAALKALLEALESAGIGCTAIIADHGTVERVYANEAIAKLYGFDREATQNLPAYAAFSPAEGARIDSLRDAPPLAVGQAREMRTVVTRPDGTTCPAVLQYGASELEDGRKAVFAFVRDVSDETRMAQALRDSEERFRALAEAAADSIAVYSGGRYRYANPVARKLMGIGPDYDISTIDPLAGLTPERIANVRKQLDGLRAGEKGCDVVRHVMNVNGKELILEARMALTSIAGEEAIVSTTRDITKQIHLHAELMKQDRLASLGLLAAGVAHELNNPLTSLSMQVRSLRQNAERHRLSEEVQSSLEQVEEAAERMNGIISDLLFMARPVDRPQAHINVAEVLRSSLSLLRAGMSRQPNLAVEIQESPPIPPIHGYASKLGQVFLNVLRNAVQAVGDRDDGQISVSACFLEDSVVITIADNGPGIPPDVLPHVTQPFYTSKAGGTGLGLWISQTLMSDHGGSLDIASTGAGTGTTVTLRLPTTPLAT